MGIVLAGSGVGGVVLAPVIHTLLNKYGIKWTLKILGIWNFLVGIPVASVLKRKTGTGVMEQGNTRVNMGLVKSGTFIYQVSNLI